MTILEARGDVRIRPQSQSRVRPQELQRRPSAAAEVWPLPRDVVVRRRRPARTVGHRSTGVLMSRASHRSRPITPAVTVLLALLAGGITLWLGLVAQIGASGAEQPVQMPTRLSVVEVQTGETLQSIAARVAPDVPADSVVERIRELNKLDAAAVRAGQTLIAPIG